MPAAVGTRLRFFTAFNVILAVFLIFQPCTAAEHPQTTTLTILHTNDIHGHLFPFDYNQPLSEGTNVGGAARRATLIRSIKAEVKGGVLVMDAGDVFERGPLQELHGVPDFAVMNAVPYDVMTLGNNEFKGAPGEEGQKMLFDRIKQAKFAIVSANVLSKATGKTILPPYKIFKTGGIKVGVFGLTTPRVGVYRQAEGLSINDPITTAKTMVAELEPQCDFIIALTHLGYPGDLELALSVPGINVIIGGDSHTWLPQPTFVPSGQNGTLVCQDGEWGRRVGELDLNLQLSGEHRYRVSRYTGRLVDVSSSIKPASDIEQIISGYAKPYMRKVGYLETAISAEQAPQWVAEQMRQAAGAQVGVEPVEAIESGIRAGAVTELDILAMFPFNNHIYKLTATGKQLREYVLQTNVGLAGAHVREGVLFIGDKKINDRALYTLAIESFYASSSPALSGAKSKELNMTPPDVVKKYLSSKAHNN